MIGKCPTEPDDCPTVVERCAFKVEGVVWAIVVVAGAAAAGCAAASVVVTATGAGALGTLCANAAAPVPHVSAATVSEVRTIRPTSAAPGAKAMRGVIRGVPSLNE
jgi:hypothetical protein